MQVCIYAERYKNDPWYKGDCLTLPTYQMAIEDAKQCARVAAGEEYSLELVGEWPDFLYELLETCSATLEELNFLTQKLSQMSPEEMDTYEGILQSVQERTIRDLINMAYNLDRFEFLPGIIDEEELGEVSIDNDLVPVIRNLPEEVYLLLSPKKVGIYVKEQEHGVFTSRGYCYRNTEGWVEPYDGRELPEQEMEADYIFSQHLQSLKTKEDAWLELPCDERRIWQALVDLEIETFRECFIMEIRSSISKFNYSINQGVEVEKLNALAKELASLSPKELIKYKAIIAYESCDSPEQARILYRTMERYTFDPTQVTFATYGRECLREGGADLEAEAFQNFDFESYGRAESRRSRLSMTPYGAISYEPPLEEAQGNELQMRGME